MLFLCLQNFQWINGLIYWFNSLITAHLLYIKYFAKTFSNSPLNAWSTFRDGCHWINPFHIYFFCVLTNYIPLYKTTNSLKFTHFYTNLLTSIIQHFCQSGAQHYPRRHHMLLRLICIFWRNFNFKLFTLYNCVFFYLFIWKILCSCVGFWKNGVYLHEKH